MAGRDMLHDIGVKVTSPFVEFGARFLRVSRACCWLGDL